MTSFATAPLYRRHRFPADVIAHAVWLYFRFPLSLRMVEDLLAARGIDVSHQTVRLVTRASRLLAHSPWSAPPHIRFLSIGPQVRSTLPPHGRSPFHSCASLRSP